MADLTDRATALRAALNTVTDEDAERFSFDACDVIDLAEYLLSGRRGVTALRGVVPNHTHEPDFRVRVPEELLREVQPDWMNRSSG